MIFAANVYKSQLIVPDTKKETPLVKNGVAGTVNTPARKSLAHPLPPVAEAEKGP